MNKEKEEVESKIEAARDSLHELEESGGWGKLEMNKIDITPVTGGIALLETDDNKGKDG